MSLPKFDPYHLYAQLAERSFTPEEKAYLDQLIQDFPYFVFPRYLKARDLGEEHNIFLASAYSVNRTQLKQFLQGKTLIQPLNTTDSAAPSMKDFTNLPPAPEEAPRQHTAFTIWEETEVSAEPVDTQEVFKPIVEGQRLPGYAYLNTVVCLQMNRFGGIRTELQGQIKGYQNGTLTTPPPAEESQSLPEREPEGKQEKSASLIDRFLQQKPYRNRPKAKSKPKSNPAAHVTASIEPDDEMVSETLAKLHWRQNNKEEAIRMYKKLRLRFPEKSAYFDAQIEKIIIS
ncbi:MAG: hypothetical protein AAF399_10805 [Bacteroidota bacterium]